MTKYWKTLFALGGITIVLSACQSVDTLRLKTIKESSQTDSNALIYCSGTQDCEFERLDQLSIVDTDTKRVSKQAMQDKIVRLNAQSLNQPNSIYLSVPAGQHELVLRFYPISRDKAEVLHVFHRFAPSHTYTFKMYRDRNTKETSLLKVSAPDPLCVDLMQEKKTIRRFCKPFNAETGIAEFVEHKI